MMSNSDSRKRQAETIAVKVTVNTDELREWAGKHADFGHHGVAHVLYKAASDGESLTDQAIREAVEQARAEVNAGWTAAVEALADEWDHRYEAGDHMVGCRDGSGYYDLLADEIRTLTADHTAALDAVKADAAREALLAAAEAMEGGSHTCFRPAGCVDCGRQRERDGRVEWLRSRAEAIENG